MNITIQHGEFKNDWLYSGNGYLREDPKDKSIEELNNEQINPENKIYTLERDEKNPNIRTLIFYTTNSKIGLDRDIQIHIDENGTATLQDENGNSIKLETEEINKIKDFFRNISVKQLQYFDEQLSLLYYTIIMNKEEYKDTNILIPDVYKYHYEKNKEINQTKEILKKIPQDKRKGKYIVPCLWLKNGHQVNLRIDFDNKICEIINTACGEFGIDDDVMIDLQNMLNKQFKEKNWKVYENNIMYQSTGNCYIASNIVATEKTVVEKKVEEYNEKRKQLEEVDKEIENIKGQEEGIKKLQTELETKEKEYQSFVNENSLSEDKEYEKLRDKLFREYKGDLEKHTETDDKSKLDYILEITKKKIQSSKDDTEKKQKYENIQKQIQQALYLLKMQELKNKITDLEKQKNDKTKLKELKQHKKQFQKRQHAILPTLTNSKGKLNTKKEDYKEFEEKYDTQIESIISTTKQQGLTKDAEELKKEKENFIRCNLLLQQLLLKEHMNQFNKNLTKSIVQKGNVIKVQY